MDENRNVVVASRDINGILRAISDKIAAALASIPDPKFNRRGIAAWDFGDLPERVELVRSSLKIVAHPALLDEGKSAALRLFRTRGSAGYSMRGGVRRLLAIALAKELEYQVRHLPGLQGMALAYAPLGTPGVLKADLGAAIAERACLGASPADAVRSEAAFRAAVAAGWHKVSPTAHALAEEVKQALAGWGAVQRLLQFAEASSNPDVFAAAADVSEQVAHLVPRDFLLRTPPQWLGHLPRFLAAARRRLEKLASIGGPERDARAAMEVTPLWRAYLSVSLDRAKQGEPIEPALEEFRWMVEELRVSLFAQELKASLPVSPQRLQKAWTALRV